MRRVILILATLYGVGLIGKGGEALMHPEQTAPVVVSAAALADGKRPAQRWVRVIDARLATDHAIRGKSHQTDDGQQTPPRYLSPLFDLADRYTGLVVTMDADEFEAESTRSEFVGLVRPGLDAEHLATFRANGFEAGQGDSLDFGLRELSRTIHIGMVVLGILLLAGAGYFYRRGRRPKAGTA